MQKHSGPTTGWSRQQPEMLYLVIGNLLSGFLLAYIFVKANISSLSAGLVTGGIVGLLSSAAIDSIMFATTTLMSRTGIAADVVTFAIISAITGAVIAVVSGKNT